MILSKKYHSLIGLAIFSIAITTAHNMIIFKESTNNLKQYAELKLSNEEKLFQKTIDLYTIIILTYRNILSKKGASKEEKILEINSYEEKYFGGATKLIHTSTDHTLVRLDPETDLTQGLLQDIKKELIERKEGVVDDIIFFTMRDEFQRKAHLVIGTELPRNQDNIDWFIIMRSYELIDKELGKRSQMNRQNVTTTDIKNEIEFISNEAHRKMISPMTEALPTELYKSFVFSYDQTKEKELIIKRIALGNILTLTALSVLFIYGLILINRQTRLSYQNFDIRNANNLLKILVHDLAGPVQAVFLGLRAYKTAVPEASKTVISMYKSQLTTMEIIRSVRSLYLNEQVQGNLIDLDISRITTELVDYYSKEIKLIGLQVELNIDKNVQLKSYLSSDIIKNQVLGNLISNAVKFSKIGSVLSIDITNQNFILTNTPKEYAPERIHKINLSRYTESTTNSSNKASLGFGLYIVKIFCNYGKMKFSIQQSSVTGEVTSRVQFPVW